MLLKIKLIPPNPQLLNWFVGNMGGSYEIFHSYAVCLQYLAQQFMLLAVLLVGYLHQKCDYPIMFIVRQLRHFMYLVIGVIQSHFVVKI